MGVLLGLWVGALVDGKVCRWRSRAGGVVVGEVDIQVPDPQGYDDEHRGTMHNACAWTAQKSRIEGIWML